MSRSQPNFIMMPEGDRDRTPVDELRRRALRLLQQADEKPEDDYRGRPFAFAAPAALGAAEAPHARALAVSVITMPAVFVVVVLGALALFGKPAARTEASRADAAETLTQPARRPAAAPSLASTTAQGAGAITLGEDSRVAGISLDGERIALHVETPSGAEIVLYDFAQGRVISSAPIVTAFLDSEDRLASLTGAPPIANLVVVAPSPEEIVSASIADGPFAPRIKPRVSD